MKKEAVPSDVVEKARELLVKAFQKSYEKEGAAVTCAGVTSELSKLLSSMFPKQPAETIERVAQDTAAQARL